MKTIIITIKNLVVHRLIRRLHTAGERINGPESQEKLKMKLTETKEMQSSEERVRCRDG